GRAWRAPRRTRSLPCHPGEACHRVVQAALHGAPRAAEDFRHLLLAEVVVVAQDDGAPLRLGERGEEAARIERRVGRGGCPLVGRHRRPGGPLSYERASRDGARAEAIWFPAARGVGRWGRGPAVDAEPSEPVLRGGERTLERRGVARREGDEEPEGAVDDRPE